MIEVYDVDTGKDVDDSFVIGLISLNPETFNPGVIISNDEVLSNGRAAFASKIVRLANNNIPVARGLKSPVHDYKNTIVERAGLIKTNEEEFIMNGIQYLKQFLKDNDKIHYYCLGVDSNLASVLSENPSLEKKISVTQMGPSIDAIYRRPGTPSYNCRCDIKAFEYLLENVQDIKLVMSHASSQRHKESGKQKLGVYPEGPVAQALKESSSPVHNIIYDHLIAWRDDGKDSSIMYDPTTVLSNYYDDIIDFCEAELVYNNGIFEITNESKKELLNYNPERLIRFYDYLKMPTKLEGKKIKAVISLNTDFDKAREHIINLLFRGSEPNLASEWKEYNQGY